MIDLACKIQIPRVFLSREDGRQFLELLLECLPAHLPQRFGREEPLKKKFVPGDLDLALEEWGPFDFIADRRKPRLYLDVLFSAESLAKPRHTSIALHHFEAADWT